jgi:hypothetical protein
MCYHPYSTQKNESLIRKSTATAPKDRFYGGTNTLPDRLRMLTIEDSIRYENSMNSVILERIGIGKYDILTEWWKWRDQIDARKKAYREKTENKIKRAQKMIAEWNTSFKASQKAKKDGTDYGSGICINNPIISHASVVGAISIGSINSVSGIDQHMQALIFKQSTKQKRNPCQCGAAPVHYTSNHKNCKWNRKNRPDSAIVDNSSTEKGADENRTMFFVMPKIIIF